MRIAAVVDKYLPGHGGAQVMLHALLRHATANGHEVRAVVLRKSPFAPERYTIDGVDVAFAAADLSAAVAGVDAIVTQDGAALVAADLAGRTGAHLVQVVHDTSTRVSVSLPVTRPDLVVFNTRWVGKHYAHHRLHSVVVHPPVATSADPGQLDRGDAVCLMNLRTSKGVDVLYDLAERAPEISFLGVIGGYGEQIIRHDLPNVEIVPFANDARQIWARTRVLLAPSWYEGYGMRCVEAMQYGIPVIASPIAGLREALGDAAVFVDRDTIDEWLARVHLLGRSAEYDRLSRISVERFEKCVHTTSVELAAWARALWRIESERTGGFRPTRDRVVATFDDLITRLVVA